jgi:antitoxin MazE
MLAKIQKWGNSKGIRIPKTILEESALNENSSIEITSSHGCIVIKSAKKHIPLKERIKDYKGDKVSEWNTGDDKGNEVF